MNNLRLYVIVAFFCFAATVRAQTKLSNNQRYSIAEDLYTRGKTDSALTILKPVLNMKSLRKMNKGTRSNICRLASQASLLLEKEAEAQRYARLLLTFEPDYQFNVSDDYRKFKILIESLQIVPKFLIGFKVGSNTTFAHIRQEYQFYEIGEVVDNEFITINPSGEYKNNYKGFQAGLNVAYSITKSTYAIFEPSFSHHSFDYSIVYGPILKIDDNQYTITANYLELPIGLRNYFRLHNIWRPYISAGGYSRLLISAVKKAQNANADIKNLLNDRDFGYWLGGGISYTTKKYSFNLGVKYSQGIKNFNNPDRRYVFDGQTDLFMFKNGDLADDVKIRDFQLSASFIIFLSHKVF